MEYVMVLSLVAVLSGLGAIAFYKFQKKVKQERQEIKEERDRVLGEVEQIKQNKLKEAELRAKTLALEMKATIDAENEESRVELKKEARRLSKKSEKLDRVEDQFSRRENDLQKKETDVQRKLESASKKEVQYKELLEDTKKELEKVSGLTLEEAERQVIENALRSCGGNVSKAAKMLNTTRMTLRYRIEKHGISPRGDL